MWERNWATKIPNKAVAAIEDGNTRKDIMHPTIIKSMY